MAKAKKNVSVQYELSLSKEEYQTLLTLIANVPYEMLCKYSALDLAPGQGIVTPPEYSALYRLLAYVVKEEG
jgi:hypothetical protein